MSTVPEMSGVDLARRALLAALEAARKNGAARQKPKRRTGTAVRRDGREPLGLGAAITMMMTERPGRPGRWRQRPGSVGGHPRCGRARTRRARPGRGVRCGHRPPGCRRRRPRVRHEGPLERRRCGSGRVSGCRCRVSPRRPGGCRSRSLLCVPREPVRSPAGESLTAGPRQVSNAPFTRASGSGRRVVLEGFDLRQSALPRSRTSGVYSIPHSWAASRVRVSFSARVSVAGSLSRMPSMSRPVFTNGSAAGPCPWAASRRSSRLSCPSRAPLVAACRT